MKNIKYLLFSVLIVLSSCGDDSYSIEYIDTEEKIAVTGSLSLSRDKVAPNTMVTATVTLDQTFSEDAHVYISSSETCGSLSINSSTSFEYVTIPAGGNTGSTAIVLGEASNSDQVGGFRGQTDCAKLFVSGIQLIHEEEDEDEDHDHDHDHEISDPFVAGDISADITLLDYEETYMGAHSKALKVLFDWENPSVNDLDMYVYDIGLTAAYEVAESGSRYEGDYFNSTNDSWPDGQYLVYVAVYTSDGSDIDGTLHFTHPRSGEVDYYEFVIPDADGAAFGAIITQTTDADGVITYTTEAY